MRLLRHLPSALSALGVAILSACVASDDVEPVREGPDWPVTPLELSELERGGMPHLSPLQDGGALLSWLAPPSGEPSPEPTVAGGTRAGAAPDASPERLSELRVVRFDPVRGFGMPRVVVRQNDLFVNWADFPSVVEVPGGGWVAHWLQRGGHGTYDYGIRVATSPDEGVSWGEPWIPHEDRSPTEHGFATLWPVGEGRLAAVWLDGRKYVDGTHGPATEEMTLRAREMDSRGRLAAEWELDARVCDCCQTDVAVTAAGPVVVYRDRSLEEVRDIHVVRREEDGWSEPRPVHRDGWVIPGCPVNGPTIDARGDEVAVAWFAAPRDEPRVQIAHSRDGGRTFSEPVRVDDGRPVGRTDVVLAPDGSAVVLWLEEVRNGIGELRLKRAYPDGSLGPSHALATTRSARASGFPQLLPLGDQTLLAAWTEASEGGPVAVRVAQMELPR